MIACSIFFQLHPSLKQVIGHTLQWKDLTRIQELAYKPICSGDDLLLTARTAGGKSEAAFIPVLDMILKQHPDLPVCLYISPLKALITDMAARLDHMLTPLHLSVLQVHGDLLCSKIPVIDTPAIILTTPESLTILLKGPSGSLLGERIRVCIIDEVHSLASSERGSQLMASLSKMEQKSGLSVQRIGLSATIGNPDEVLAWMSRRSTGSQVIMAEHEALLREFTFLCGWDGSESTRILPLIKGKRSLIFAGSRGEAETLSSLFEGTGLEVFVHHSSLSSATRNEAEQAFIKGKSGTIICTGTLELGIDIGALDLVVHSGPVFSVSSFLQRLGRVGRRGNCAQMVFMLRDPGETALVAAAISSAASGLVENVRIIRYPYRVLVQQIIITLLSKWRVSKETLIRSVSGCDWCQRISDERISLIISSLIRDGFILLDHEFCMPGPTLESWADQQHGSLFSVIGDGKTCMVRSSEGDLIGTVSSRGAGRCRTGSFRLGGISWVPTGVHSEPDVIQATPIRSSAVPPVFGGVFQGTSYLLMQQVAKIVRNGLSDLPFPDLIREGVHNFVLSLPEGVGPDSIVVRSEGDFMCVYSFLGDEWNRILCHYLKEACKSENFRVLAAGSDGISVRLSSPDITSDWIVERLGMENLDPRFPPEWIWHFLETDKPFTCFLPEECLKKMLVYDQLKLDDLLLEMGIRRIILAPSIRI
ncbi:MAG TPA: DEAD/DEAH box helicase [Methanospirillum sp.]|uniref:DEAD/DEAH box helicase n=1 Tax=Methanospirillum sp. TaxID=45200 RepID=UPI002B7708EF|nr:DEAD/DEAH box helicase [Methanospirillum sp.]HWQ63098.1 DEAD/DEAH box helicase [Methanospirillum sp.]